MLYLDYSRNEKVDQNGDTFESAGFQFVQDFPTWGSEYYLGYRWHSLDRDRGKADYDDISALMTGHGVAVVWLATSIPSSRAVNAAFAVSMIFPFI